ncbi:hypothetical protein PENTCL1PPCAC_946, partial [Pristionchus entomophagus]
VVRLVQFNPIFELWSEAEEQTHERGGYHVRLIYHMTVRSCNLTLRLPQEAKDFTNVVATLSRCRPTEHRRRLKYLIIDFYGNSRGTDENYTNKYQVVQKVSVRFSFMQLLVAFTCFHLQHSNVRG